MNKHLKTFCDKCVFAEYENNEQKGCSLNRAEKLGIDERNKGEDGNTSFLLGRMCNAYRPTEWLSLLDFEESLNPEDTVMTELYPPMAYFIRLRTDEDDAIGKLTVTLDSIVAVDGPPPVSVLVITDKVEYNQEVWELFIKYFGEENAETKYHIVQISETPKHIHRIIDEAFTHALNSWIMTTSSGHKVRPDTTQKLHELLNVQMQQAVMIEPYDGFNGMIFPAYLFKFLNGNKTKIFEDEIMDGRAFLEKVQASAERTKAKTLYTSEEFYAS
jgi:hypothetical protein